MQEEKIEELRKHAKTQDELFYETLAYSNRTKGNWSDRNNEKWLPLSVAEAALKEKDETITMVAKKLSEVALEKGRLEGKQFGLAQQLKDIIYCIEWPLDHWQQRQIDEYHAWFKSRDTGIGSVQEFLIMKLGRVLVELTKEGGAEEK